MIESRPVVDWMVNEVRTRLQSGKDTTEAASEVAELARSENRLDEIWQMRGAWLVSNIYQSWLRDMRSSMAGEPAEPSIVPTSPPSTEPVSAVKRNGHLRVYDVGLLRGRDNIFDAEIQVGHQTKRYGDMTHQDWAIKELQYRTASDNATSRYWAASKIKDRVEEGKRTEECLTAAEFRRLLPSEGW